MQLKIHREVDWALTLKVNALQELIEQVAIERSQEHEKKIYPEV